MAYRLHNSTGYSATLTRLEGTPTNGDPSASLTSPIVGVGDYASYLPGVTALRASDGLVRSSEPHRRSATRHRFYVEGEPVTLRRAPPVPSSPFPPTVAPAPALRRGHSPIYAPPASRVHDLNTLESDTAARAGGDGPAAVEQRPARDTIYSRRGGSSPQLVSATARVDSRAASPVQDRTPRGGHASEPTAEVAVPPLPPPLTSAPTPPSPAALSSSTPAGEAGLEGIAPGQTDPLRAVLRTFTDECHELLAMLRQDGPTGLSPPRCDAEEAGQGPTPAAVAGPPTPMLSTGGVDPGRLAFRWSLFLLEARLEQLRRFQRRPGGGAALGESALLASAVKAASRAREAVEALREAAGDEAGDPVEAAERCVQLCTTVSNALTALTAAEDDVLVRVFGCPREVAADSARSGDDSLCSAGASAAAAPDESPSEPGPSREALVEELRTGAVLLCELQTENASLKHELQEALRRREKTKRHLARERAEKADMAKHFDVVAGDNAELHRRIRQLEEELSRVREGLPANPPPPLTSGERAELEAGRQEVARLTTLVERHEGSVRDLRNELLACEQSRDALRRTIAQMRDSLVRHRTVIDLLTRDQLEQTPLVAYASPRGGAEGRGPQQGLSKDLIGGILSGALSIPTSSPERDEALGSRRSPGSISSPAFEGVLEYELSQT